MTFAREKNVPNNNVDMDHDEARRTAAWSRISQRLNAEFGEDVYTSWFARLELDALQAGLAYCSVPTKFLKSWIQSHYQERILVIIA
jgi:chromosomal replication initiator protein